MSQVEYECKRCGMNGMRGMQGMHWSFWVCIGMKWVCKAGGREIRGISFKCRFRYAWYAEFTGGGGAASVVGPFFSYA